MKQAKVILATVAALASDGAWSDETLPEHTLDSMSVTAAPIEGGYATPPTALSATKTDVPLLDTPVSVQIVTREVMDDQQSVTVKDALKNVSGVGANFYNYYDFIQIRGFDNGASNYYNGLQLQAISGLETALLDHIEVVKGPASILYGRIDPGGLVNLVTKKPQAEFAASLQQQAGNYGFIRTTGDVTGSMTEDNSVLYRFIGAYSQADSFMDVVRRENAVGAAYFTFQPNSRFDFNLRLEAQDYKFVDTEDIGIPIVGNRPVKVRRSSFFGDEAGWDDPNNPKRTLVGFDWTFDLNEQWKLTQRFHWDHRDEHQTTFWSNGFDGVDTLDRGLWYVDVDRKTLATNVDLVGKVNLAGMQHTMLFGTDWNKHDADWNGFSGTTPVVPPINIYRPDNHMVNTAALRALDDNWYYDTTDEWYGVYLQDQVALTDRWQLLVGGRYDWARTGFGESGISSSDARANFESETDKAFSPRAGLLYKLNATTSVYGSYSESFGQNNGRSASGEIFDPQNAQQYEIGAKYSAVDESLTASLAIFDLEKDNILTADNSTPDPNDQKALGKVRNRGLELDVAGRVTSNVSLIASYTYYDMEITQNNDGNEGNRPRNVPRNSASFWGKYDSAPGAVEGWQAGAGAYMVGEREGNDENTWQLPGYTTLSAMFGYRTRIASKSLLAQINIDNLLDKDYYERGGYDAAKYGTPRTFIGSIKLDF